MQRDTRSAYRARAAATERMVDESVAAVKAERDGDWQERKTQAAAANTLIPFTEDEYRSAQVVRTKLGWFQVVRVNAKSVTVRTGHSWDDRISRTQIIEVR